MSTARHDELLKMRQENIGRLFQRAARAYSDLALVKLAQRGHEGLTLFHTTLIAHLDLEGTQISTLAERAGVTKQAMGQAASELEARQYVVRIPDPADKRAVLIQFTDAGLKFLEDAYQVKLEIESIYLDLLGEADFKTLQRLIARVVDAPSPKTMFG